MLVPDDLNSLTWPPWYRVKPEVDSTKNHQKRTPEGESEPGQWLLASPADFQAIKEFLGKKEHFSVNDDIAEEAFIEAAERKVDAGRMLLVYVRSGESVAFAYLTRMSEKTGKLEEYGVFRKGMGIGREALEQLCCWIKQRSVQNRLSLNVVRENSVAMRLYEKQGFVRVSTIKNGWTNRNGKKVDIHQYEKRLV